MDRFKSLVEALDRLATDPTLELHDRLRSAEAAKKSHFGSIPSEFTRLRGIAGEGRQRPAESDFWTSVDDIACQLAASEPISDASKPSAPLCRARLILSCRAFPSTHS
jgi:hypothetical protein